MKLTLIFFVSLAFTGCVVKEESNKSPTKISQSSFESTSSRSHGIQYQEALIEVDTDLNEIKVDRGFISGTAKISKADGSESEFQCGFSLADGSQLAYELIDPSTLHLNIDGRILKLYRIHASTESNDVFGDWVYSEAGKNFSRRWTFFIQDNDIMNVDFDCSNEF